MKGLGYINSKNKPKLEYDSGMRTFSKSLLGICLFTFTAVSWATCPEGTKNNYKGECVATTSGSETVTTTNAAYAG